LYQWDDGGRQLIGGDGFTVTVEPTLWRRGDRLPALIDSAVPENKIIAVGAREDVPKPSKDLTGLRNAGLVVAGWAVTAALVVAAFLSGLFGVAALVGGFAGGVMYGFTRVALEDWLSTRR